MEDYRTSHTAGDKGSTYADSFTRQNNKKFTWEWEQVILRQIATEIKRESAENADTRYLDFACGTGRIIGFLESEFDKSFGVDVSESMLSEAKSNAVHSTLQLVDITKTCPFDDASFNLITAFRFFVNAQDELRDEVMGVLARLLKKDGRLIFNVHINSNSAFSRIVKGRKKLIGDTSNDFRSMSISEAESLLMKHSLRIDKTFHRGLIPIFDDDSERPPFGVIKRIEDMASRASFLKGISRYVIFVCSRVNN